MIPRIEALALSIVLCGFGLVLAVDPPVIGGFVVAAGAEMMILGQFVAPSTPLPR